MQEETDLDEMLDSLPMQLRNQVLAKWGRTEQKEIPSRTWYLLFLLYLPLSLLSTAIGALLCVTMFLMLPGIFILLYGNIPLALATTRIFERHLALKEQKKSASDR